MRPCSARYIPCGECTKTLRDTVKVITYKMDAANGYLKKNGELDPALRTHAVDSDLPCHPLATPFGIVTLPTRRRRARLCVQRNHYYR